jgi:integrase
VWRGFENPPKSRASGASVPVIAPLAEVLAAYKATTDGTGRIFPMRIGNIRRGAIKPGMKRAKVEWKGFHSFRRGLASTLFALGADDLTAQSVLRHASVQVTREHYLKNKDVRVTSAMAKLADRYANRSAQDEANG